MHRYKNLTFCFSNKNSVSHLFLVFVEKPKIYNVIHLMLWILYIIDYSFKIIYSTNQEYFENSFFFFFFFKNIYKIFFLLKIRIKISLLPQFQNFLFVEIKIVDSICSRQTDFFFCHILKDLWQLIFTHIYHLT